MNIICSKTLRNDQCSILLDKKLHQSRVGWLVGPISHTTDLSWRYCVDVTSSDRDGARSHWVCDLRWVLWIVCLNGRSRCTSIRSSLLFCPHVVSRHKTGPYINVPHAIIWKVLDFLTVRSHFCEKRHEVSSDLRFRKQRRQTNTLKTFAKTLVRL